MRIGIFTPPDRIGGQSLETLLRQVQQAERDDLASFWFVQLPTSGNDVLTTIAIAGQQTSRIELGTAVVPIYSRHPLAMAQQAATTQVAAGGRFSLGIGLSHKPVVESIMGLSYGKPAATMREYLSVLRPLIDQGQVNYTGQRYSVNGALQLTGATPFPILIAALAPRMLQIAGELADGTITWMAGRKTIETHIAPRINSAAAAAARPQPRICVALPVAVTDDTDAAKREAGTAFHRYGQLVNYRRVLDIEGVEGPGDVAIVGNEGQVERQLRAFAAAGATDFLASVFPVGEDATTSEARTWAFLKSLKGKVV